MATRLDGVIAENDVVRVVCLIHHKNLVRLNGNIARLIFRSERHGRVWVERLVRLLRLLQHVILRTAVRGNVAVLVYPNRLFVLSAIKRARRHVVDRVAKCFRADRRPFRSNMLVIRNGLVEIELRFRRCDVAVLVGHIPAFKRIAGTERTRNDRLGRRIAPIGGNFFDDIATAVIYRAAVQMEGYTIRRGIPNRIEAQVALDGKRVAGLRPAAGVPVHRPLHVRARRTKRPTLERPFLGAVIRTVGTHGGRAEGGPIGIRELPAVFSRAIDHRVVLVLVIQLVAVRVLGHLRAVGQPDRAERHLAARREVVGGRHVGDGVAVPVVVEVQVVGVRLRSARRPVPRTVTVGIPRAVVGMGVRTSHVQARAGVLLFDRVRGHRLHLAGDGVVLGVALVVVLTYGVVRAMRIIVFNLTVLVRNPHQIIEVVFGDRRVVYGHQIQEVLGVGRVVIVDADLVHAGDIQIRDLEAVVVAVVADAPVEPVGHQVVAQAGVGDIARLVEHHRPRRVGDDLGAHGCVRSHNGGLAGVVLARVEEATLAVLAIGRSPRDHPGRSATIAMVVQAVNTLARPGNGPDVAQVRTVLGADGDGLRNGHILGVAHVGAHPSIGVTIAASAVMACAVAEVEVSVRNRRAMAEAVAVSADSHTIRGRIAVKACLTIISKLQLIDIAREVDVDCGFAIRGSRSRIVVDSALVLMHDLETRLGVEIGHVELTRFAHGGLELFGHLRLDATEQFLIATRLQQRRIGLHVHRKAMGVAVVRLGSTQLRLMSHRSFLVISVLLRVVATLTRVAAFGKRLHIIGTGQILGPKNDANLGFVRSPLGHQMQRKDAAALLQLGFCNRILSHGKRRAGKVEVDILIIVVTTIRVGRRILFEIAPTGKRIARTVGCLNICEVYVAV